MIESADSSTRAGDITLKTKRGDHTMVVGITRATREPGLAIVVAVAATLDVAGVVRS